VPGRKGIIQVIEIWGGPIREKVKKKKRRTSLGACGEQKDINTMRGSELGRRDHRVRK